MKEFMDAWKVNENDFPHSGTPSDKLLFCLNYAILAPSTYNIQPWHFVVDGNEVYLYADRRYALAVIDPDDRELSMGCAAALYNLRLSIRYFGYDELTEFLPDPNDKDLIAKVKLGQEKKCDDSEVKLFKAIVKRHTNRGAFADKEVAEDILHKLKSEVANEAAWLHICTQDERSAIVQMVVEADHIQTGNKQYRRELASWVNPRRAFSGDGMPDIGLSHYEVMNMLTPSVARRFEADNHQPVTDAQLDAGSPVIAVLGTRSGGSKERIYAGQAMMRLSLMAEVLGLSISTLNQPCEVPELRLRLHDEIEQQGRAHMILRIGYGGKPVFTPRRLLSDVISIKGSSSTTTTFNPANDENSGGFFRKVKNLFSK